MYIFRLPYCLCSLNLSLNIYFSFKKWACFNFQSKDIMVTKTILFYFFTTASYLICEVQLRGKNAVIKPVGIKISSLFNI